MTHTNSGAYLEFIKVGKSFPGVRALDDISFDVREGSVHALVGENGAGKSTLLKVLSGAHEPTDGHLTINGREHVFKDTASAIDAGVAVIYQELHLVPEMTVAENLYLGHMPAVAGTILKRAKLNEMAQEKLNFIGEDISPTTKLGNLPIAQRQMVEIAKALSRGAKVIAFDEPTSSLSDREVRNLFRIIKELRDQGHVILYVSHRMEEIFKICDSATVFRDGKHVETFDDLSLINADVIVQRMIGREIRDIYSYRPRKIGSVALDVQSIDGPGLSAPASFSVAKGEILGFFGLVGAGRSELMKLIYGAIDKEGGRVFLDGELIDTWCPKASICKGIVFCSEDRKEDGIIPLGSVQENTNLSARRHHSRLGFWINERWEKVNATEQAEKMSIKTPSLQQQICNLSGGNQQKVILARWLSEKIKVIIMDEPTRGIDVGAKNEIYQIMYDLAETGVAVIMISSELPEVIGVADRILVMREGEIVKDVAKNDATEESILKEALPIEQAS